jgi:hypothetical protein
MADTDVRSQRLQWIRDGSNWLVGISTGALVLSATYFYDRFDRHPRLECLLILAWILLIICSLLGVFTSFSSWKDLQAPPLAGSTIEADLGGWVTRSDTTMMWTFLGGYLLLAVSLFINATIGGAPLEKQKVEITLPPGVAANLHLHTCKNQNFPRSFSLSASRNVD